MFTICFVRSIVAAKIHDDIIERHVIKFLLISKPLIDKRAIVLIIDAVMLACHGFPFDAIPLDDLLRL